MDKYITPFVIGIIAALAIGSSLVAYINRVEEPAVGGFGDPFLSIQLAPSPGNGDCLTTNGTDNSWSECAAGSGSSATTTINGVSGPSFTFATGTATGIGLTISSSTGTLTFTPTVSSGYVIPLSASTSQWATAFGWGNHATAGYFSALADFTGTLTDGRTCTYDQAGGEIDCDTSAGAGTVTSVDMTVPTGLSISGNPITTSGTLALSLTSGYVIPLSASTTNWNNFYDTPSGRITAGDALTWSGNTLNFDGGNIPGGVLGGTWASPTLDDN